jgi:hypothetical protein
MAVTTLVKNPLQSARRLHALTAETKRAIADQGPGFMRERPGERENPEQADGRINVQVCMPGLSIRQAHC